MCCACKAKGREGRRVEAGGDTYGVTPVRKYLFPTKLSSRRWKIGGRAEASRQKMLGWRDGPRRRMHLVFLQSKLIKKGFNVLW